MRRLALLGLCVSLCGCEFNTWHQFPFVAGHDPYLPTGDAVNLRRAEGLPVQVKPLQAEEGNIWPTSIQSEPTLQTIEQGGGILPNEATPPPVPAPRGSSTAPALPPPAPATIPPVPQVAPPPAPNQPAPPVINTPAGPGAVSGGGGGYKTITLPNGTTGIVVPNGNGTSTVIFSNGTVQTVPTPK